MSKIKEKFDMFTYTKKWTTIILVCCIVWIFLAFVIALVGDKQVAQSLGSDVLGLTKTIFCAYIVRAFFDSYAQKRHKLELFRECCQYGDGAEEFRKISKEEDENEL